MNTEPIQSLKFQKHDYGKKEKKHSARDQVDVRAPHQRTTTNSELKDFHDQVKKVELATGKKIGLSFILPHSLPKSNNDEPATQHPDTSVNILRKWRLASPDKVYPVSMSEISLKAERVKKRLFESVSERNEIEQETRNQHTHCLVVQHSSATNNSITDQKMPFEGGYNPNKGNFRCSSVQTIHSNETHEGGH